MLAFTQHSLEKIEGLFKSLGYRVRYEKGNFKTGACMLQSSRIIVVNKFSNLESKIISLSDLLKQINADEALLDDKQKQFLYALKQTELEL
ncbi:MAG: hypothetical protein K0S09_2465 [Sphingobacteriaceae bacterium]|jgi:hypothetical protein|nr:hypothetical protein [Sphingobacteriaceae bacterium]